MSAPRGRGRSTQLSGRWGGYFNSRRTGVEPVLPGCEDQRSEITFDLMPDSRSDTENEKPPLLAWRGGGGFRARKTLLLLQPGRLRDLLGQVLLLLLEPLAEHEPREAADLDVLADLRDRVGEDLLDLLLVVLHEELLDEAVRLVELLELAGRDLLEDRLGLLLIAHLGLRDLELLRDELRRDLLAADPQRRGGRDLHRDVLHERLEPLGARDEVRLAVHLDEHPDLAAHVDVARDGALGRGARRLLRGGGEPLLAEQLLGLHEVAARLCEHLLAVHHPRPGLLPELLHELRADLGHLLLPSRKVWGRADGPAPGSTHPVWDLLLRRLGARGRGRRGRRRHVALADDLYA